METEKHSAFLSGTIQTYIPEKRYGFIRCGSLTYFFHQTAMETPFEPEIGKKVTFVPSENRKGRCAVRVRPVYPKVKGEFGYIPLPNKRCALDNRECIAFLRAQHEAITQTLDLLTQCGITATMSPNGWVTLDTHAFDTLRDAGADGGNRARRVPSGYPDTFANLLRLLERQLNHFNRVYSNLQKGMAGERNTAYALRSVEMRYPVLYNVLFEEGKGKRRFSAESDAVVLTNRAMFLVETKNYGGKGDVLRIAADGRWTVYNPTKRKTIVVSPNPSKQISDHVFVMQQFLQRAVGTALPIVPVIAIANNNVSVADESGGEAPRVLRSDMLGTFILNRIESCPAAVPDDEMARVQEALESASRPAQKYEVLDYRANIRTVCDKLLELSQLYQADCAQADRAAVPKKLRRRASQKNGFSAVMDALHGIWKMVFNR